MNRFFLGADIGGTGIKINVFDATALQLTLKGSLRTLTEAAAGPEQASWKLAKLAREAVKAAGISFKDVAAIGVATPGPCDYRAGLYLASPNLSAWNGFEMKTAIDKILGLPSYFLNDGSAAALAEKQLGVGSDKENLVLLTVGTGIGAGYVDKSGLFAGSGRFAMFSSELGHIGVVDPLDAAARACSCGAKGHLEAYASFSALIKRVEQLSVNAPTTLNIDAWRRSEDKGEFAVVEANKGVEFFRNLFEESAKYLARGLITIVNSFAPEIVAIGGGATALDEFYLRAVSKTFKELVAPGWALQREIPIVNALLGNDAGVIGAALYAQALSEK